MLSMSGMSADFLQEILKVFILVEDIKKELVLISEMVTIAAIVLIAVLIFLVVFIM